MGKEPKGKMTETLNRMIKTSYSMIELAKKMTDSCQRKKNKVFSRRRFVSSFILRRSWELFESFLILIKRNRIVDSAVLLRSLCEMGINLGYIFANDIDDNEKEIRATRYLLEGDYHELEIKEKNRESFRELDKNIDKKLDNLKKEIDKMKDELKKKYGLKKEWKRLPTIKQRAELSSFNELLDTYNLSYSRLSLIEHHSMNFGRHYVNARCEPIKNINPVKFLSDMRLDISLTLYKFIFIEILDFFNDEFRLTWKKQIKEFRKIQDEETKLVIFN